MTDIEAIRERHATRDADKTPAPQVTTLDLIHWLSEAHTDRAALLALLSTQGDGAPIDMVLFCPKCGLQHEDERTPTWENPPHRSHLCHGCGNIWRPADVPTNGVKAIKTKGKADSAPSPAPTPQEQIEDPELCFHTEHLAVSPTPQAAVTREELGKKLFAMFSGPAWSCWGDHGPDGNEYWYKEADAILALFRKPQGESK